MTKLVRDYTEQSNSPGSGPEGQGPGIRIKIFLMFSLVFAFFVWHFHRNLFIVDDAFISFRYIFNFVEGHGLVYNQAEAVEGYSNFLWVLLLLGPVLLGAKPQLVAVGLGFFFGISTILLLYHFARKRFDFSPATSIATSGLLAAFSPWVFWAGSGLESSLFSFLLLVLAYGLAGEWEQDLKGLFGLFAVTAAMALTRPEGFAYGAVLFLYLAIRQRKKITNVLIGTTGLVVPLFLHLIWRYHYYGDWVANTVHAKSGFSFQKISMGITYLFQGFIDESYVLLIPLFIVACGNRQRALKVLPIIIPIGMYLVFIVAVGGDGLYEHRFLAHITPLLVLLAAIGAAQLVKTNKQWRGWLLIVLAIMVLAWSSSRPFYAGRPREVFLYWETKWINLGKELANNWPDHLVLATNVGGKVPYFSRMETIDMLGFCDRTIALTKTTPDQRDYAGHTKANPQYILEREPDIIYLSILDGLDKEQFLNRLDIALFLQRTPLFRYSDLIIHDSFAEKYQPAILWKSEDLFYNLYLKRGSLANSAPIPHLKIVEWQDEYRLRKDDLGSNEMSTVQER